MILLTGEMADKLEDDGYQLLRVSPKHIIAVKGEERKGFFESDLTEERLRSLPMT